MPILYESTDPTIKQIGKKTSLGFSSNTTWFLVGLVAGFIILPIALPVIGYQVNKRWASPPPPPR